MGKLSLKLLSIFLFPFYHWFECESFEDYLYSWEWWGVVKLFFVAVLVYGILTVELLLLFSMFKDLMGT